MKFRKKIIAVAAGLLLAVAITIPAKFSAKPHFAAPTPAAAPAPAPAAAAAPAPLMEPHPEIREAIEALRRARNHMQRARHDFGGHRVDAIRAADEAIRQLRVCLKYDRD